MKSQLMGGLCALLYFVTASSEAASIWQKPEGLAGSQDSFVFSGFDSSLGTLTSVNFSYSFSTVTPFVCTTYTCTISSSAVISGDGPLSSLQRTEYAGSLEWWDFLGPADHSGRFNGSAFFSSSSDYNAFVDAADFSVSFQLSSLLLDGTATDHSGSLLNTIFEPPLGLYPGGTASLRYVYTSTVAAVPIPAAAWLFGSGLLGLFGVARYRLTSGVPAAR